MPKKITDRYSLVTSMLPSGKESDGTIDLLAAFPHWGMRPEENKPLLVS